MQLAKSSGCDSLLALREECRLVAIPSDACGLCAFSSVARRRQDRYTTLPRQRFHDHGQKWSLCGQNWPRSRSVPGMPGSGGETSLVIALSGPAGADTNTGEAADAQAVFHPANVAPATSRRPELAGRLGDFIPDGSSGQGAVRGAARVPLGACVPPGPVGQRCRGRYGAFPPGLVHDHGSLWALCARNDP